MLFVVGIPGKGSLFLMMSVVCICMTISHLPVLFLHEPFSLFTSVS